MSQQQQFRRIGQYELLLRVGSGAQGVVWKARKVGGDLSSFVALKIIDIACLNEKQRDAALGEVRVLSLLSSSPSPATSFSSNSGGTSSSSSSSSPKGSTMMMRRNSAQQNSSSSNRSVVMRYIDSFIEHTELAIVIEWADGGTLGDWISKRKDALKKLEKKQSISALANSTTAAAGVDSNINSIRERKMSPTHCKFIWHVVLSIAAALEVCHSQKVIHRDLKTENIFFESAPDPVFEDEMMMAATATAADNHNNNNNSSSDLQLITNNNDEDPSSSSFPSPLFPRCFVGDFGVSKILDDKSRASSICGTPYYLSPEMCRGDRYDTRSDMWSLGVVSFLLCNEKLPFEAGNYAALILKIVQARSAEHDQRLFASRGGRSRSSPVWQLKELVDACLRKSPSARPTAAQLLTRPFVIAMASQLNLLPLYSAESRAAAQKLISDFESSPRQKRRQAAAAAAMATTTTTTTAAAPDGINTTAPCGDDVTCSNGGVAGTNTTINVGRVGGRRSSKELPPASMIPLSKPPTVNNNKKKEAEATTSSEGASRPRTSPANSARTTAAPQATTNNQQHPSSSSSSSGVIRNRRTMAQDRINRLSAQQQQRAGVGGGGGTAGGAGGGIKVIDVPPPSPTTAAKPSTPSCLIRSTKADKKSVQDLPAHSSDSCSSDDANGEQQPSAGVSGGWGPPLCDTGDFAQHSTATEAYQETLQQQQGENGKVEHVQEDDNASAAMMNISWKIYGDDDGDDDDDDVDDDDTTTRSSGAATAALMVRVPSSTTSTESYDVPSIEAQVSAVKSEGTSLLLGSAEQFERLVRVVRNNDTTPHTHKNNNDDAAKNVKSSGGGGDSITQTMALIKKELQLKQQQQSVVGSVVGDNDDDDDETLTQRMQDAVHLAFRLCLLEAVVHAETGSTSSSGKQKTGVQ